MMVIEFTTGTPRLPTSKQTPVAFPGLACKEVTNWLPLTPGAEILSGFTAKFILTASFSKIYLSTNSISRAGSTGIYGILRMSQHLLARITSLKGHVHSAQSSCRAIANLNTSDQIE